MPAKLSVSQTVWFTHKEVQCVGKIVKIVGDVFVVEHNEKLLKGPREKFRLETVNGKPLQTEAVWAVVGYRKLSPASDGSPTYVAQIALNGIPVLKVANRGANVANVYTEFENAPTHIKTKFYEFAKAWAVGGIGKADELFIEWDRFHRPASVSREEFFEGRRAALTALIEQEPSVEVALAPNVPKLYTVIAPDGSSDQLKLTIDEKREWKAEGYRVEYVIN